MPEGLAALASPQSQVELKEAIKDAVTETPNFNFDANLKKGATLRINFLQKNNDKGVLLIQALLSPPSDKDSQEFSAFASIDVRNGLDVTGLRLALAKAFQDLKLMSKNDPVDAKTLVEIVERASRGEKIESPVLINAVARLGGTHDKEFAVSLKKLITTTEDLAVGNACIMALGQIGDQESMEAIINYAERKAPLVRRQAIIAARSIASPLAAQWLFVMAYGHEDPTVRKEALAALKEVEASEAARGEAGPNS